MKKRKIIFCQALAVTLLLCAGCTNMLQTKPVFNSIVTNTDFQKAFQPRTIRLIAPASANNPEIIEALRTTTHLNIDIPGNLIEESIIFHANSDENRLLQLKNALYDKSSKTIIWTLRGGYGSARLIDYLSQCPKPKVEKIFIGSSDITALHLFLSQQWGWQTIHGAGLAKIVDPNQDPQNFQRIATIISKSKKTLTLSPLLPLNEAALNTQKISGRITGGNLTIIQTSIGTPWQIQTAGKILFLEEVGEKGYRIDRNLNHLKQAGLLKEVQAIIFGQLIAPNDSKETTIPEAITIAIERFAKETQIPVFKNEQFGHGYINYPIVYHAESDIVVSEAPREFTWIMQLEN
jgi:muramoyltetrapeptide carboxypeptidase